MDQARRLVEWAYPNAVSTLHMVFCPKNEAFLHIRVPLHHTGMVGDIMAFHRHVSMGNGLGRTVFRTFPANLAECVNSKRLKRVIAKRKVCKYLADPYTRSEFPCDEKP